MTTQGHRKGVESLVECKDPRGLPYFWIGSGNFRYDPPEASRVSGSDLEAIHAGYISITPLSLNLTHESSLNILKGTFEQ
jgi:5'-nucleotidase